MKPILAELIEEELHKRHCQPIQPELRSLYREDCEAPRKKAARRGLWTAVAVYLLFSIVDVVLIPDVAPYTIAARFAVSVIAIATLEAQIRLNVKADWVDGTCAAALVFGYVSWLCPAILSQQTQSISYYMIFGAIFMMGANLFFTFGFRLSLAASAVVLASFFCAMLLFIPVSLPYQVAFGTFYISCFTFTSYVNWKLNRERYHVFLNALQAELRQSEVVERGKDLLRLSNTDPLTGLDNRRAIDEKLRRYWNDWQKSGHSFGAILIDIDFFKKFNDCYGHQEGDRCLVLVANALADLVEGREGSIGRYGGEEFIVLVRSQMQDQVAALAEAVRRTVEDLALVHEQRRDGASIVTVSVGAAFTRSGAGPKLERLINEADSALYRAKAIGRNCARLFDPNDPESSDESENIAALLRIAIAQDLVSLAYQPIQNVASGRIEAVEALMRLKMLDGTPVSPRVFIPIAERTGAILELGRWALRTACREILAGNHAPLVSINVSAVQLKTPGFSSSVAAVLSETGVTAGRLAFEITEGLEIDTDSDVLRCIGELKQLGIRIWLDDFGTGFAGLSWLRLIEFDTVKIDRSFLHDSALPKGAAMLQDIIGLIRNRGHRMIAEGVETEEQMTLMRNYRIDQVQGFHIGYPAPAEKIRALSRARTRPIAVLKSA